MKTKGVQNNQVNIITLGCAKNRVDSEDIFTQLRANGIEAFHEREEDSSQIIIVNTCGFIESAKEESINTILEYAQAKEEGYIQKLYVTGCLSERYREDLEKEIPLVDAFFGTRELPRLLKQFKADYKHELLGERLNSSPHHYAYLKISEGCDRPCAFCAIPLMRGKHRSNPIEQLVQQAEFLARNGTKELLLIAQDLTFYGLDLYKKRNLAELLEKLAQVKGIEWIRLHYAFPSGFPMDVLPVMREYDAICNYLDMPLQHISDHMLKSMRRGINRERTEKLIAQIREEIPGIALRSTFMTGFPGETEDDFEQLCDFLQQTRLDRVGVFTYSHEENTHAFQMEDDVPEEIKQDRADTLMAIQQEISLEKNEAKIGQNLKVLIDRKEGGYFVGRTEYDSPEVDNEVLIPADPYFLRQGDFVQVRIERAAEFDLYAVPIEA